MAKIAVTTASGALGSRIIKATVDVVGSDNVIGLARTPSKAQSLGVEIRPGDYDLPEELTKSLGGIDTVLLVSGMAKPEDRIQQHRNVIDAAKNAGVRKIVFTSIQGPSDEGVDGSNLSPIAQCCRQTENDIRDSGLLWSIGRNGPYIEPDVEYIETYKARGEIANCAGDGKCGYTTRDELAFAYAQMLTDAKHDGQTYTLHGESITQQRLAEYLNGAFGTELVYRPMSVAEYLDDRTAELGEIMGPIIAGIYENIRNGGADNESHFKKAAGREHQDWQTYFDQLIE